MPDPAVGVRDALERDAEAVSVLLSQLGHPAPLEVVTANLRTLLSTPGYGTFVGVLEGRVVGVVSAFVTPVLHRPRPVGRVSVLVVHEHFTGRGIGAILLRRAEVFLGGYGCSRIEVTSGAHREGAHRFYLRQGYALQGVRFSRDLAPS